MRSFEMSLFYDLYLQDVPSIARFRSEENRTTDLDLNGVLCERCSTYA